jgi:ADP-heptose:LPS heptosyltransferase
MSKGVSRIILSRTDNIGDVVLTLPMAGLIKARYPDCEIVFMARGGVKPVVDACPHIDAFVDWDQLSSASPSEQSRALAGVGADVILHVFPVPAIAKAARRAGIPRRIGTTRRWYHLLTCNERVRFSRKRSDQHEAELNLRLLEPLGIDPDVPLPDLLNALQLSPNPETSARIQDHLAPELFNVVLHPGSRGNGKEWPQEHFISLVESLPEDEYRFLITGSDKERRRFAALAEHPRTVDLMGQLDLTELVALLARVDGVVASGTGPLHIAAALGTPTLGLFPTKQGSIGTNRWGPLGRRAEYLVHQESCETCSGQKGSNCPCMAKITPDMVTAVLNRWARTVA